VPEAVRERVVAATCTVLVVGEFKKGKSTLVNSLVSAPVCPVDDDIATARMIAVRYADAPVIELVYRAEEGAEARRQPIPVEQLAAYTREAGAAHDADAVERVEVGLPRNLLQRGLVLMDTPGVGGLGSLHRAAIAAALPDADAVLFVTDASQELTASELEFLRTARALCPRALLVVTKTDFYPAWRTIVALDQEHLGRAELPVRIVGTAAPLRQQAVLNEDHQLNAESGYAELVQLLRDDLAPAVEVASAARAADELGEIVELLASQFRGELATLADPRHGAEVMADLQRAKEQAERLRGQASRWQQTLGDGINDLMSDIDHELRVRMRDVVRDADDILDHHDPGKVWTDFEPWLSQRVGADVVAVLTMLHKRSRQLSERVAELFGLDRREIAVGLDLPTPDALEPTPIAEPGFRGNRAGWMGQTLTALRGTTGGFVMLSVFSNFARTASASLQFVPSPLLLGGVGLFMGRKAFKDERQRMLAQRRHEAKQAMRRFTDDVGIAIGKEVRDAVRRVNRQLREYYVERAELLQRAATEAQIAAQQMARASDAQRAERHRLLDALLAEVDAARRLLAEVAAPA
jgi:hypothetical protein